MTREFLIEVFSIEYLVVTKAGIVAEWSENALGKKVPAQTMLSKLGILQYIDLIAEIFDRGSASLHAIFTGTGAR